ncbi:MAG TPA: DUF1641 domain-containing protein [Kineosporiaceae bacterium]|nr:DUF1641 domain-containing protein [Kineosporiaceae bacterium]
MTTSADLGVDGSPGGGAGGTPALEERLDRLTAQVERIGAVLQAQQEDRERWQALAHDLTGVAQGAMAVASRELEDLSADVSAEDVVRFLRTATRTLPKLEVMLSWAAGIEELAAELTALSGAGMATLSGTLAEAESRGYFDAAREGGRVADRLAHALLAAPDAEPPSTLALLRRLRDPRTRRGLGRALVLLQALGEPSATATAAATPAATARP